eukprot:scaffold49883_cov20-Phaeocystis_antarctica.AAC.1
MPRLHRLALARPRRDLRRLPPRRRALRLRSLALLPPPPRPRRLRPRLPQLTCHGVTRRSNLAQLA